MWPRVAREMPGILSRMQLNLVTGHWPGQANPYPVSSESICLSINGVYVANVGGAESLKRSMGMKSGGAIGGHAVSMICFIYTAHFGTWQLL